MIYCLEFDKYWESKEYHTDAHSALLSIYDIFRRREIPCFLLYRYKLPNLDFDWVNPRSIQSRFGITDPSKIDYSKIKSKYIIIYHIQSFLKDSSKLEEFLEWSRQNDIDVFMPIKRGFKNLIYPEFWRDVETILQKFDYGIFPVKEIEDEFKVQRLIERGLKLDDLLS